MTVIWDESIVLADGLARLGLEASDRSAVSRAYYGAFNLSRRWLEMNGTPIDNRGAHKQVWEAFRAADRASDQTRDEWILIGNLGRSLRGLRNQADYVDLVPELGGRVVGAVHDAERISRLILELGHAD
jgi:hypothetical protein